MAVLLQKVMLNKPKTINPQPISQLRLLQSLSKNLPLIPFTPRPRHLMLIKQPKLHGGQHDTENLPRARRTTRPEVENGFDPPPGRRTDRTSISKELRPSLAAFPRQEVRRAGIAWVGAARRQPAAERRRGPRTAPAQAVPTRDYELAYREVTP